MRWQRSKGGGFSEPAFYLRTCPAHPIRARTCSAITRRLGGWLGASGTQDSRALRLWQSCRQWRAQPWSCMDAAPGCRFTLAAALLSQHIDGVARAGSAGTRSGSRARFLVLLTLLAPVVENRTVGGSARARPDEANSQIADRGATPAQPGRDLPTSSVSAVQLILQ